MMPNYEFELLNGFLRGELAAVETYGQVLDKFDGPHGRDELKLIRAEHHNAVNILRQQIARVRDDDDIDSGIWGRFVEALIGASQLVGDFAALHALREGEESGVQWYEKVLGDPNISDEFRTMIRIRLLPQAQAHIPILNRLMDTRA